VLFLFLMFSVTENDSQIENIFNLSKKKKTSLILKNNFYFSFSNRRNLSNHSRTYARSLLEVTGHFSYKPNLKNSFVSFYVEINITLIFHHMNTWWKRILHTLVMYVEVCSWFEGKKFSATKFMNKNCRERFLLTCLHVYYAFFFLLE